MRLRDRPPTCPGAVEDDLAASSSDLSRVIRGLQLPLDASIEHTVLVEAHRVLLDKGVPASEQASAVAADMRR
ncbi:hypothetical protein [Candidatus Poriferisodalis sp.]|uniref:hypothetical protein n=1 Tax=Candidatus Poriferisodalis sp. TaxID=3101277 RepID=UPI003C6F61E2